MFQTATFISVFLLFNSNPCFLLSSSTKSNIHCKSPLFSAINSFISVSQIVYLVPSYCNSWINELISASTRIATDCSQYFFLIIRRSFPSIFNCVSYIITSSCLVLSMEHRYTSFCTSKACSIQFEFDGCMYHLLYLFPPQSHTFPLLFLV